MPTGQAMRIVCDTNVLLSAYLFRQGALAWLREAVDRQKLVLVFNRHTAAELLRVLNYEKFALTKAERESVLLRVMLYAEVHVTGHAGAATGPVRTADQAPVCRDAHDQAFIDLAYSAAVHALVTGDKDLLVLAPVSAVPVIAASALRSEIER
ncbi:MAG: putative toxin-antitoxin system toxin component, PIN family [Polaromonas sp.]